VKITDESLEREPGFDLAVRPLEQRGVTNGVVRFQALEEGRVSRARDVGRLTREGRRANTPRPTRVSYEGRQTHHDDLMRASAVNRCREQLDEPTA
jgi:hypothetical protein